MSRLLSTSSSLLLRRQIRQQQQRILPVAAVLPSSFQFVNDLTTSCASSSKNDNNNKSSSYPGYCCYSTTTTTTMMTMRALPNLTISTNNMTKTGSSTSKINHYLHHHRSSIAVPFSTTTTTTTTTSGNGDDDTDNEMEKEDHDDNNEGWLPPTASASTSASASASDDDDDENENENNIHDESENQEWVPPIIRATDNNDHGDSETTTSLTAPSIVSSRINDTIIESSRQVKQQERIDKAMLDVEKEAEALFVLSEDEMATLSDDEILKRLDIVLQREDELIVQQELELEMSLQKELELEELELNMNNTNMNDNMNTTTEQQQQPLDVGTDWLRNRRAVFGGGGSGSGSGSGSGGGSGQQEEEQNQVVPAIHHTMLTSNEIELLLKEHGGRDIKIIYDNPDTSRMGVGCEGMIFCTGGGSGGISNSDTTGGGSSSSSSYLIYTLSRVLIDHMKERKLHEIGVTGAKQNTTNKAAMGGGSSALNSISSKWMIVDCGNYIVHVLDSSTRNDLRLEDLWSGKDPLWKVNSFDDDQIEEYCYRNPVPEHYSMDGIRGGGGGGNGNDPYSIDMKKLERDRFGLARRHKPVISQSDKNRDRRAGNKRRREQRQREYFGGD